MSPPTRFGLRRSSSARVRRCRARIRSRKPGAKRSIWRSMRLGQVGGRAVRHVAVGPGGVLASGARVASNRLGWASSTKGRRLVSPSAGARSEAAISSSVPPRWTVPARAHAGAAQGSARERPVELEDARARSGSARAPSGSASGRRSPASRRNCRGSRRRGRCAPSSSRERLDRRARLDLAAERAEVARRARRRCAASRRAAAASPPRVRGRRGRARTRRCRRLERQDRVGGEAGEERPRAARPRKRLRAKPTRRLQRRQPESRQRERVARDAQKRPEERRLPAGSQLATSGPNRPR